MRCSAKGYVGGPDTPKNLGPFSILPCRNWPGLRLFFLGPLGVGGARKECPSFGFSQCRIVADLWPFFDQLWPCMAIFDVSGHHGGGGTPNPTPYPHPHFRAGWGTRPPINKGPTPVPPWVSSEGGPSPVTSGVGWNTPHKKVRVSVSRAGGPE